MVDENNQDEIALTWQMTISREDFLRCLPAAVDFAPFRITGNTIECGDSKRGWRMTLTTLPDHRLGALRLEQHDVEFRFFGYSPAEVRAFISRMEVYFRRGGG